MHKKLPHILLFLVGLMLKLNAKPLVNVHEEYILEQIKNENIDYEIYTIKLMDKGYLFMGTNRGLFYYDGTSIKPAHPNHFGKNKDIIGLLGISKNCLLGLPYWGKLLRISNESKFCGIEQPEFANSNYKITSAYQYNDSLVYLLCTDYFNSGSLLTYNIHSNRLILQKKEYHYKQYYLDYLFPTENIKQQNTHYSTLKKLFETSNEKYIGILGKEYLAINSAIYKRSPTGPILMQDFKPYSIEGRIISLFKENDSLYYIGVVGKNHGLYRMQNQKLECIYNLDDVSGIQINENNMLFFSTVHNGLYRINLNNPQAKQIHLPENLSIQNIQYYPETKQTLLADITGSIYSIHLQQKSLTRLVDNRQNKVTNALFLPNDPNHFSDGRFIYNLIKTKVISHHHEGLKVIHFLKIKDTFYNIGNNYMWKLDKPTFTHEFDLIRADKYINSTLLSDNDTLLFATDKGLLYNKGQRISHYSTGTTLDDETILHLAKNDDTYFYTTSRGIYIEDRNTRELSRIEHLNTTQSISCIPYKNSILYIHESGFIKYDRNGFTLDRFEIPNYNIENRCIGAFLMEDTLVLYNHNAIYTVPLAASNNKFSPHTLIIRSLQYGTDTLLYPESKIPLTQINNSFLEIKFDLFYTANAKVEAVLLNESTNKSRFIPISNNTLLLDNLNPGNYILNLLVDNTKLKTFTISISSPWYYNIWIIMLFVLCCLLILYYSIHTIVNRRNEKKINEIIQKNHLLQLETQSKLNQLKPHFIFNALMPLQHYIVTSDKTNGLDYLKKLSVMLRQVMNLTRKDVNSIADELKFLDLYLHTQQIEKSNEFTYKLECSADKSIVRQLHIPSLMLQPLVENSLIHGCSGRSNGILAIHFDLILNDSYVQVTIKDNGDGFDHALLNQQKTNALNIIQERIKLLRNLHPQTNLSFEKSETEFIQLITLPIIHTS